MQRLSSRNFDKRHDKRQHQNPDRARHHSTEPADAALNGDAAQFGGTDEQESLTTFGRYSAVLVTYTVPGQARQPARCGRAVTTALTSSARASSCIPAGGRWHGATREHARSASPGYQKRDRGRHQLAYEETETSPRIHHTGSARSSPRRKLTTLTCANPKRMVRTAVLRTAPFTHHDR